MTSPHIPVLLGEVVDAMQPAAGKTLVDGTFGAGGYSRALLERGASVIAFDRDPSAARFARGLPAGRFRLVERRFSELDEEVGEAAVDISPDGVVLLRGARWRARTNRATPIKAGEPVKVVSVEGLVLEVEPPEGGAQDYRERARNRRSRAAD